MELRCGMVALVGRANVGKSSLMNRVLAEKVSIVSSVPQTTRNMIRGIHTEARGQLVFLDTPGVHKAGYDLGKIMNRAARASIDGVDIVLLLLDATSRPRDEDEGWMRKLIKADESFVFVLSKCDLDLSFEGEYRRLFRTICTEKGVEAKADWIKTSAQTGEGIDVLLSHLFDAVPTGPYLFPDDMITDFPRNTCIADTIREKLICVLKDELPHAIAVKVKDIAESADQWVITADILVNRQSQKGIVIGKKGRILRKAREDAASELSTIYEKDVKLDLWVKVEKNWAKNHWILRQLGYT